MITACIWKSEKSNVTFFWSQENVTAYVFTKPATSYKIKILISVANYCTKILKNKLKRDNTEYEYYLTTWHCFVKKEKSTMHITAILWTIKLNIKNYESNFKTEKHISVQLGTQNV